MDATLLLLLQLLGPIGTGVGLYVAIRADLAKLHERTMNTKERADHAHERIDTLILERRS